MKLLDGIRLSLSEAQAQLAQFGSLLQSKAELSETADILPFFAARPQLCALIGLINSDIDQPNRLAFEFDVFGDFRCDLAVGSDSTNAYTLVEFEDARAGSVFTRGPKHNEEWGRRFEHGFSQLVDWFWRLEDQQQSAEYERRFAGRFPRLHGMLVVGRRQFLTTTQSQRLLWRSDRVIVNSRKIACLTFDDLFDALSIRLRRAQWEPEAT